MSKNNKPKEEEPLEKKLLTFAKNSKTKKTPPINKKPIEQYEHKDKKRTNNPPVGLVTPETDKELPKKKYAYDPHLDPQLQWAGKTEHLSFKVDTVSLHVHERIDPRTIIESVRKKNGSNSQQMSLFNSTEENPPIREAIDFYKHNHNWSNRLIAGDSLLVMNSLIEKEGLAGQVQMVYIDPPYGIKYGSNFQPFINKRDVKDGKDEDLNQEPEMIKAFRDTWELGIHSYLTYLRDRLLLARELLNETGSCFVQISDENVHHVREIMDEVFGNKNFIRIIFFKTTSGLGQKLLDKCGDYIVWYSKDITKIKYHQLYKEKIIEDDSGAYNYIELKNGDIKTINEWKLENEKRLDKYSLPKNARIYSLGDLKSQSGQGGVINIDGETYSTKSGSWKTNQEGINNLLRSKRINLVGSTPRYKRYFDDFPYIAINNMWGEQLSEQNKSFVVQTGESVLQRCLLMTTDTGDLILDPTCGSGTSAFVAEQWGRRWITCDTSRVALTLAKQRMMTALFDYYQLAHQDEGVGSGFKYKTVPHITLKSIANNEPPATEILYDQPFIDNGKTRVTGPFTVEAVPAPGVKPIDAPDINITDVDNTISRSGETIRQAEWRAELLKTGIRGKNNQFIMFSRVEPMSGTKWIHADAETKPNDKGADTVKDQSYQSYNEANTPVRAVISFGPEHAPMEQRQVALALEEAQTLVPRPKLIIFAALQFDPEAAKDIDETKWPGITLLKAQINTDLFTDDLKKKRSSNESFWLIGQPDVLLKKVPGSKKDKPEYQVEVLGFDYYNTKTGQVESGSSDRVAVWMLDTDYDGRSLFPRQVFFPMAGEKDGWSKLAKDLKAEIDEELIEAYKGTTSLSFTPGDHNRIAVKIMDDRGVESLKILNLYEVR